MSEASHEHVVLRLVLPVVVAVVVLSFGVASGDPFVAAAAALGAGGILVAVLRDWSATGRPVGVTHLVDEQAMSTASTYSTSGLRGVLLDVAFPPAQPGSTVARGWWDVTVTVDGQARRFSASAPDGARRELIEVDREVIAFSVTSDDGQVRGKIRVGDTCVLSVRPGHGVMSIGLRYGTVTLTSPTGQSSLGPSCVEGTVRLS